MNRKTRSALLAISAVAFTAGASAATSNGTLAVNIDVTSGQAATSCTVTAAPVNLSYVVGSSGNNDSYSGLTVSCDGNLATPVSVSIDNGSNPSGNQRRAYDGVSAFVNYNIVNSFSGLEFTTQSGTTQLQPAMPPLMPASNSTYISFFAKVSPGQTPTAGAYTDSLTVTLDY